MEGLASLLFYALLFYLMMRFGCGAHMVHGHGDHSAGKNSGSGIFIDPVCAKEVDGKPIRWYSAASGMAFTTAVNCLDKRMQSKLDVYAAD